MDSDASAIFQRLIFFWSYGTSKMRRSFSNNSHILTKMGLQASIIKYCLLLNCNHWVWRYRLQIIVILVFTVVSFARQANTEPLNFSVNVIVDSGYDYFTGKTIAISPSTEFTMSFTLGFRESWIQTTTDPEYQTTKSWLYLNSSSSLSPFTSQLLSVAGDVPLQYSNQSFARQVYTDYFDPDHYDAYDRSLHLAEGFNFYDDLTNRRYQYWRGLTITLLAPLSSSEDVSIFDQNTLSDFISDALSGNSDYILSFHESGIWQDLTTYTWGPGYIYSSNNVSGIFLISEPSTFLQLAIGLISLALIYCSRMGKFGRYADPKKSIFIVRIRNSKSKRLDTSGSGSQEIARSPIIHEAGLG